MTNTNDAPELGNNALTISEGGNGFPEGLREKVFQPFYRAPDITPEWLLRAQSVCFGTTQTGLPDTYGWLVLALGPLSMLLGLVVALGRDLRCGLVGLLAILGGNRFVALLLEPIRRLHAGVERLADGDLATPISPTTQDVTASVEQMPEDIANALLRDRGCARRPFLPFPGVSSWIVAKCPLSTCPR